MKKIIDLGLTYFPSDIEKKRICGHTFEVLDYYLFFKYYYKEINTKIIIFENLNINDLKIAYYDKIDYKYHYLLDNLFKNDLIFKPKYTIFGKNLLCTSDFFNFNELKFLKFKNYYTFLCVRPQPNHHPPKNYKILADTRIYGDFVYNRKIKHYVKKISFQFYKKINYSEDNTIIYINSILRYLNIEELNKFLKKYKNLKFIAGNILPKEFYEKFEIWQAPVKNFFEKFNTYVYTKTAKKFDCSPRLLLESFLYNKKIIFDLDEDFDKYIEKDLGLKWRWFDIQNNINNLILSKDDEIKTIIFD